MLWDFYLRAKFVIIVIIIMMQTASNIHLALIDCLCIDALSVQYDADSVLSSNVVLIDCRYDDARSEQYDADNV